MRTIAVITTSRADYGIYVPLLRRLQAEPEITLKLIVAGLHLLPEQGLTEKLILADGFEITERVPIRLVNDAPEAIAAAMGEAVCGFARALMRHRPDLIVVLGDRFEMHAAALAALPFRIPVAHLHGGELTQGAIDDALRHSMTKLSHLHFVSTEAYARRVQQLGEEPWRITVSGAPSLDQLATFQLLSCSELSARLGWTVQSRSFLMVTFHPVTLEYEQSERQANELVLALQELGMPVIFSLPNSDTGRSAILHKLQTYLSTHPGSKMVENPGTQTYFSLMAQATAMVGNSSSGILEAPSFKLPVVNIGNRQDGRLRGSNVIDVACERSAIVAGVRLAASPGFRDQLRNSLNPYFKEDATGTIFRRLKDAPINEQLLQKIFQDIPICTEDTCT